MCKDELIYVTPKNHGDGWADDFRAFGIAVPGNVQEMNYTPVNHAPMPFSVGVDLCEKKVVKRIVGVMPNALHQGHIYNWDEFCRMIENKEHMK